MKPRHRTLRPDEVLQPGDEVWQPSRGYLPCPKLLLGQRVGQCDARRPLKKGGPDETQG